MTQKGLILLVALTALAVADPAQAQFYKGKTITMIINYPAGGPTDIEGRIVAQHLPAHIAGKPNIIIKNVGGAGGVVGTNQLAEAAPNGDTMGFFTIDVDRAAPRQSGAARQLFRFRDDRRGGGAAGRVCAQGHAAWPQGCDRHHAG